MSSDDELDVSVKTPNVEQSSSISDNDEHPTREAIRSSNRLKIKERQNKALSLSTQLCCLLHDKINQYSASFYDDVITVCELDELLTNRDALKRDVDSISEQYQQLEHFSEHNKVNEPIQSMFKDFMKEAGNMLLLIENEISEIQRLDSEMEVNQRKLEEQLKLLEHKRHELEARRSTLNKRVEESPLAPKSTSAVSVARKTIQEEQALSMSEDGEDISSTSSKAFKSETTSSSEELLQKLVNMMGSRKTKRSAIEPSIFDGSNVLEFQDWEIDFDAYVVEEELKGAEPLRHMKRFLAGEARKSVNGYFTVNTKEAYHHAREHLRKRYGDKLNVAKEFRRQLTNWPKIPPKDGKAMEKFSDFLEHCRSAMIVIPELAVLNDCEQNERMSHKLPDWMKNKWARKVAKFKKENGAYPSFAKFSDFVKDEAEVMAEPILQQAATQHHKHEHSYSKPKNAKVYLTNAATNLQCLYCEMSNHKTADCFRLEKLRLDKKREFAKQNRLCYGCLLTGHQTKNCKSRATCKRCKKPHPTAMHWDTQAKEDTPAATKELGIKSQPSAVRPYENDNQARTVTANTIKQQNEIMSMIIPVHVSSEEPGTQSALVYALLDTQSDVTFIAKQVAESIKAPGSKEPLTISTLTGSSSDKEVNYYKNLKITGLDSKRHTFLSAYETSNIPCSRHSIPSNKIAKKLEHVKHMAHMFPPPMDIPIGLLIGVNCPQALAPIESIVGEDGEAFAIKTMLGWTLCGGAERSSDLKVHTVHRHANLSEYFDHEFAEPEDRDATYSQDDLKFMKIMKDETIQREDDYIETALPFRDRPFLPNNRQQALERLRPLRNRFQKDMAFKEQYSKTIEELLAAKQAEDVINEGKVGEVWYIPHFAVTHPKKKSLRVVFDCSARFDGTAINDHLLQGPDHMNNLLGILLRFRQHNIAVTCDIQKMFYNFYVKEGDRDYLRFLWFDKDLNIVEKRMCVHIFGATSSPAVATYGLRALASKNLAKNPKATDFITRNFYVDDGLLSIDDPEEAIEIIQSSRNVCATANIRLHKFLSNEKTILKQIPETERCITDKELLSTLPTQRTLGLNWNSEQDVFEFSSDLIVSKVTKRGILSVISSIFDPLGFLSPFSLKGKAILQDICKKKLGWDDKIGDDLEKKWDNWINQAKDHLESIKVERCMKSKVKKEDIARQELHHFADASSSGYGSCSYLRTIDKVGNVHCSLVMAKARVAPIKPTTIPRLELQAAVTSARQGRILTRELDIAMDAEFYWTDSMITLGYIQNDSRRFKAYVANRVAEIQETTNKDQWHYVKTTNNPADIVSRGADLDQLKTSPWFKGPQFLWQLSIEKELMNGKSDEIELLNQDPELKLKVHNTKLEINIADRFQNFSNFRSLIRAFTRLRTAASKKNWKEVDHSNEAQLETTKFIIKACQEREFGNRLEKIIKGKSGADKSLKNLDPYLDEDGLLRVGGRIQQSVTLHPLQKHPYIIPKNGHLAKLIATHFHDQMHHTGARTTMAAVRDAGYWLINGKSVIKEVIHKCVVCRRLHQRPVDQKMGQLPRERVEQSPPFTHVGMDVFGPFVVRDRRSEIKRWGLLLTCMYSRAVHVEMLDDLSTDGFLIALRNFIALRGKVSTIFCDQGTNFVGACNELQAQINMVADEKVKEYMLQNAIKFKFNPPEGSHRGGTWERLIRSIRCVLNGMRSRYKGRLSSSTLRTAFYESACIVNSRPLTATDVSNPLETVITPNHLLTMKTTQPPPPPGRFVDDEIYSKKRWRMAQQFAEEFWLAWRAEFLGYVTKRQKWLDRHDNIKVGDVVLITSEATPRNEWRMGVVTMTIAGADGLIRRAIVRVADGNLDSNGKRQRSVTELERPIQKLIQLIKS